MRNCPSCGEMLNDNTKVCPRCGIQMGNYGALLPCPRCGEPLNDYERFCHRCGLSLVDGYSENDSIDERHSSYRPLITILIILCLVGGACYVVFNTSVKTMIESAIGIEDEHITFVKNGSPVNYPNITYDEAFSEFFSNRSWEYFVSDKGLDVVEFHGDCYYYDTEVTVTIQFVLDVDEGTFEMEYLAFNDVPQSVFMSYALITKVFESY